VTGVLWAVLSGIGFGLFQALNGRAVRQVDDAYLSTFFQLTVATLVLVVLSLATEDLGQLGDASPWALASFAIAGLLHFLGGWTFLNLSQERIGAARTSPLLTTTPLFAIAIAAATLGELPTAVALLAIALMVVGAYVLSEPGDLPSVRWRDSLFAFGTSFMWALSPVFTLQGLEELDSPLLGVAIGLVVAMLAYGLLVAVRVRRRDTRLSGAGVPLKVIAGAVVALATWSRWEALDLEPIGVVLALNLVSVPVVLLLAPLFVGGHLEQVSARIWLGAALVVGGSLALIAQA
jgi:drug/metabolite transporter (DMT)-like permease